MDRTKNNNPFRKESGGRIEKTKKESEWGKVKFNPVAKTVVTEQATPWSHFKNEIIQKQKHDKGESQCSLKNPNAQDLLKKREEKYRRNLIGSKRNEPTRWEDFSDEIPTTAKADTKKVPRKNEFQTKYTSIEDIKKIKKSDFDSRMLKPDQNNFFKKVITRHTSNTKGVSFKQAVKDMKFNGVKKDLKKNIYNPH